MNRIRLSKLQQGSPPTSTPVADYHSKLRELEELNKIRLNHSLSTSSTASDNSVDNGVVETNGVKHILVNSKSQSKTGDEEDDEPCDPGMKNGLKHFYSGKEDKKGRFQWQEEIPEDVGDPAENEKTAKWALLVRNVKVYNDPRRVLSMHSIVVQSPLLKKLLASVLKGYPGVTVGLNRLEFTGKFEPLIHRWYDILFPRAWFSLLAS